MLFNSIEFFIFLVPVFILYWFPLRKNLKGQNFLLLLASYIFYGWWDWRFLFLILSSSLLDFYLGKLIFQESVKIKKKVLLSLSLIVNLGLLGFFKYFNFFIDSFSQAFTFLGHPIAAERLDIILPVGISFYTFQTLSYTLDVYRKKIDVCRDMLSFLTFVSFFPQLVAGPIERASHLIPQFQTVRKFDYTWAISGAKLFVWGFFKKVVIADNAATLVNGVFSNYENQSSLSLLIGSILFSFQIYGDFSGYSDMSIGLSRIFGFDLISNFRFPFLSRNISVFWKRWHISLSSWFRDYLYIPLGGNRFGKSRAIFNVFIVFLISGFWHGANWTFIVWGLIHGCLYIIYFLGENSKRDQNAEISISFFTNAILTFALVTIAFVFFRSESILDSISYLRGIFTDYGTINYLFSSSRHILISGISAVGIMILMGYEFAADRRGLDEVNLSSLDLFFLGLCSLFLGAFKNQLDFIYFQF